MTSRSIPDPSLQETTIRSIPVFKGKLLDVRSDVASLPDGSEATREWIKHPGACAVVPIFPDGTTLMIRQFRYPLKSVFLEVPAGKIDLGEPIDLTASRELKEETGLVAQNIHLCGHFHPCIGYSDEVIHVFCAWDLESHPEMLDEDEFIVPVKISFEEALKMSRDGTITDAKTISSLQIVDYWWRFNGPFPLKVD